MSTILLIILDHASVRRAAAFPYSMHRTQEFFQIGNRRNSAIFGFRRTSG